MKNLTENKLRNIIREEMQAMGEGAYLEEFKRYLSSVGKKKHDLQYSYMGHEIVLDPMGYALHISVTPESEIGGAPTEPPVSATVEDGGLRVKGRGGRPQDKMYRSPDQVINMMMKMT